MRTTDAAAPRPSAAAEMMTAQQAEPASWASYYTVALLVITSVISYIDRQILPVLLESVRADLGLTDTQMGLLTGAFFSGAFAIAGIPLARLSDYGVRRSIIAACMFGWSVATAFCGLAQNYVQLAIGRMAVAVGEAGSAPASYSLLADRYPESRRARIFSLVSCGSAVGLALGVYLAGTLNELIGWRNVFLVLAVPGIIFAILIRLTVREPARSDAGSPAQPRRSLLVAARGLWALTTYRWLLVIAVFASSTAYAIFGWMPTFLTRVHGLSGGEVGARMGAAVGVGLLLGNLSTGLLADILRRRDPRWLIWVAGCGLLACIPTGLLAVFWPNSTGSVLFLGGFMFFNGFWSPLLVTIAVGLVDNHSRALAASTIPIMLAIGGAVGPLFVGVTNDALAGAFGQGAIRYSIAMAFMGCLIAAASAFLAGGPLRREYQSASGSPQFH